MLRKLFSGAGLLGGEDDQGRALGAPFVERLRRPVLVEGVSKAAASSTATLPRSAWTESAERIALRRALRLTLTV